MINKSIFRQYDIRGKEGGGELSPQIFELIGKAYGTYLTRKGIKIAVCGRDIRATSQEYQQAAIAGLLSVGIKVINLGVCLTPMMYWAQYFFKSRGGVMITASHNPKGWNGAKLASDYSQTMSGDDLQDIYKMIIESDFVEYAGPGGREETVDIREEYFEDLIGRIDIKNKFKIVVNTGNGTAGPFAPELLQRTGSEIIEHNIVVDSDYPNYTPNPSEMDMIEDTARVVLENKADLGFAFDGDGDRLGLVDETGQIIWPDQYLIFLARDLLNKKRGAKIIFDVKSSQAIADDIEKNGGEAIMTATGHTNIKRAMKKEGAQLASELSGHVYIAHNYYGFDDALFTALSLLEYFSKENKKVSQLFASIPQYVSSPGYNATCADDKKFMVVDELKKEFKKENYNVIDIDGARVEFPDLGGWGLVRASNTSGNLTLRFEAKTKDNLKKIEQIFRDKLARHDFVGKEWIAG